MRTSHIVEQKGFMEDDILFILKEKSTIPEYPPGISPEYDLLAQLYRV